MHQVLVNTMSTLKYIFDFIKQTWILKAVQMFLPKDVSLFIIIVLLLQFIVTPTFSITFLLKLMLKLKIINKNPGSVF